MTTAAFKFSPAILSRLGEELNQSPDQSILELVKNSYDANALLCTIELSNATQVGGSIKITDDGDGMDAKDIEDGWLVLGKSSKSNAEETRLGRKPAGSKGLGRLAALRMGEKVALKSIKRDKNQFTHYLNVDWAAFDNAEVVEDVELEITTKLNDITQQQGVTVELQALKTALRAEELKRLARALLLLTDPFGDEPSGFKVELIAPEFQEVEALLKQKYFDQADYHLQASINDGGFGVCKLLDWQENVLAEGGHEDLRRKKSANVYRAPKLTFDLWVFILGAAEFTARTVTKAEITNWLHSFGGVHIYQEKIRVTPYGNPGNDWLEMNVARLRSPEERPGTHTSIGRVTIPGSGRYELKQKTDRTGFIEDETFSELKEFAQEALNWMARWRLDRAEIRRRQEKEEAPKEAGIKKEKIEAVIASLEPEVRAKLTSAFSGYEKSRDKEAEALKKEVQLYRTLSTAGITAATFAHEAQGNPLKIIVGNSSVLIDRIPLVVNETASQEKLLKPVKGIAKAAENLTTLSSATLKLVESSKRRMGRVSIHDVITETIALMAPFVEGRDASVQTNFCKGDPYLRTSVAAVESIFTNLINNALSAFQRGSTSNRLISITTQVKDKDLAVIFSDSGPGIVDIKVSEIWLPGMTTNSDGTGLGLTIVKDTIRDIGGKIDVLANGSLGGAEFVIHFPILGT